MLKAIRIARSSTRGGAGLALVTILACASGCFAPGRSPGTSAATDHPPAQPVIAKKTAAIRLVSFNIYNRPFQRDLRLKNASETLKLLAPDIVALQEVAQGWILPGDPLKVLGDGLPHKQRYWHETNLGVFKTGLAVLSRYPVVESEYIEFSRHRFWDAKGFMRVKLRTDRGQINVVNVHLASTTDEGIRESEFGELTAYLARLAAKDPAPFVIAGDFNANTTHPAFASLLSNRELSNVYGQMPAEQVFNTWSKSYRDACSAPSGQRIDYVLGSRTVRFIAGQIHVSTLEPHPSDHCPVVADFTLSPTK